MLVRTMSLQNLDSFECEHPPASKALIVAALRLFEHFRSMNANGRLQVVVYLTHKAVQVPLLEPLLLKALPLRPELHI